MGGKDVSVTNPVNILRERETNRTHPHFHGPRKNIPEVILEHIRSSCFPWFVLGSLLYLREKPFFILFNIFCIFGTVEQGAVRSAVHIHGMITGHPCRALVCPMHSCAVYTIVELTIFICVGGPSSDQLLFWWIAMSKMSFRNTQMARWAFLLYGVITQRMNGSCPSFNSRKLNSAQHAL